MSFDPTDANELTAIALEVASEAASFLVTGYRSRPHADEKSARNLVTRFDRESQELILDRLSKRLSRIPVIAEEGEETAAPREGLVAYVDPLDGTTNYVHGHPFWSVAIGILHDDAPVVGAVVAPMLRLAWTGWLAGGVVDARRNGEGCRVSAVGSIGAALLATGFPPVRDEEPASNLGTFVRVKRIAQGVRRCGSASVDVCMVGDGTYDAYWERRLAAWDVVAASAVALAAGARITSLDGGPPNYHVGNVVVSNGLVHDELLRAIAERAAPPPC